VTFIAEESRQLAPKIIGECGAVQARFWTDGAYRYRLQGPYFDKMIDR